MNKVTIGILSLIVLGTPLVFADSERDEKLEFAGTLEETLGHFWALELNLDEKNSELALVHATHPIAELYDTMSKHLKDNPDFDEKLKNTLLELKDKANTTITRQEAQLAIDDAKMIIQEAREIVVGSELSDDASFKTQLINGLLETSKIEYKEAIVNGIIEEMAEFQDGSAFVWQSEQIFKSLVLDPSDSEQIITHYAQVWSDFDARVTPEDMEKSIDMIIHEFEELSGIQSVTSEHESQYLASLSPLKQIKEGVAPKDIQCKSSLELIFKYSGNPACVKQSSIQKLIILGWSQ